MKRKICPHCKTHNPDHAVFCKRCGALFQGEPAYKDENNVIAKNKNTIIFVVCIILLVLAFIIFKSGSAPETVATTPATAESTTVASTTLPTTLPPTTTQPTATQAPVTEALTLPTLPSTTKATTTAPTTAPLTEEEIEELCDEYNSLIYNLKYSDYAPTIHKTVETSIEIKSFSLPVNTERLNTFIKNLLPKTDETYTFSADGVAAENPAITLESYIPPIGASGSSITSDDIRKVTTKADGTITFTFKPDKSTYSDGVTDIPPYVSTATDYLDFATFALGPVGITKADISYPKTMVRSEVDADGDIIKLSIRQPVTVNCTGGVGRLTADISMDIETLTIYKITY